MLELARLGTERLVRNVPLHLEGMEELGAEMVQDR